MSHPTKEQNSTEPGDDAPAKAATPGGGTASAPEARASVARGPQSSNPLDDSAKWLESARRDRQNAIDLAKRYQAENSRLQAEITQLRAELQGVRLGAEGMGWAPRSPVETTPVIVGWAVGDLHGAPAMYNINEFDRASDAARRWGKPITGLVQAPNTPTFAPRPYSSEGTSGQCEAVAHPTTFRCALPKGHDGKHAAVREYHANGTYWSGVPTVDMPCDFCKRPITDHDPRTHACPPEKASEPRELTASEAASFSKTLARSPRVLEKAGARPTPQQLGERHADTLRALAEDVCKCRGKLGWTRDESGTVICPHCRLPITHPENGSG